MAHSPIHVHTPHNLESTMIQIYEKNKDEDGFLYMEYSNQEAL